MPDGLVRDGELSEVHADHLRLHFNTAEHLSVVNSDDRSDHLRHYDHVAEVGLNTAGLLARGGLLLGLAKTLDERHGLSLQSARHASTGTGRDEVHEFVICEVEEGIELDSTELELPEGALLAQFGNFFGVHPVSLTLFDKVCARGNHQERRNVRWFASPEVSGQRRGNRPRSEGTCCLALDGAELAVVGEQVCRDRPVDT